MLRDPKIGPETRHLALVLCIVFSMFSFHNLVTGGKSEKNRSAKRTSESQHSLKLKFRLSHSPRIP